MKYIIIVIIFMLTSCEGPGVGIGWKQQTVKDLEACADTLRVYRERREARNDL